MPRKKKIIEVFGLVLLAAMAVIGWRNAAALRGRAVDRPPTIDFAWTGGEPVSLLEDSGRLTMRDDYALDFTAYRLTIVELDKTLDLPIPGMAGREYSQDISLSLIADNPVLLEKKQVTLKISISDDSGQTTEITRVVKLR